MEKITSSLSLMRRLPPNNIGQNLSGLLNLIPEETDELLQRIDQPLQEIVDTETGRSFILCDYNRDGDSYRSPWSNKYFPHIEDGFLPSERLRALEMEANELFDAYRELYFEGGLSSVYLWDLEHGFAGCFLIKKSVEGNMFVKSGNWDSIHVIEVVEGAEAKAGKATVTATYKLTTTIMLSMGVRRAEVGDTSLSGSLTRQVEATLEVNEVRTHMANMGRMIEDMESDMRNHLNELYVLKTRHIINSIRAFGNEVKQSAVHIENLNQAILGKNLGKGKNQTGVAT